MLLGLITGAATEGYRYAHHRLREESERVVESSIKILELVTFGSSVICRCRLVGDTFNFLPYGAGGF